MEEKMKVLFGMNYKTTITGIFTVISLIPEAILYLGLAEIQYPVMTAGSRRTLSLTDAGLAFFDRPLPPK